MTLRATCLLSLTLLLALSSARADIPPPPGFVETCTVETQAARGGGPCESASTFHGSVDVATDQALRARGLSPRCTGGGATVGTAVYCTGPETSAVAPPPNPGANPGANPAPTAEPATPSTPAPASSPATPAAGSCSVSPGSSTVAPLFLLIAALLFRARRSRRAPSRRSTR